MAEARIGSVPLAEPAEEVRALVLRLCSAVLSGKSAESFGCEVCVRLWYRCMYIYIYMVMIPTGVGKGKGKAYVWGGIHGWGSGMMICVMGGTLSLLLGQTALRYNSTLACFYTPTRGSSDRVRSVRSVLL